MRIAVLLTLFSVALAGCASRGDDGGAPILAQANQPKSGAVREARTLIAQWQSHYTENDLYRVTHLVEFRGDGTFKATRKLTAISGVVLPSGLPPRVTIPSAGTWRLHQEGVLETFDLAGVSLGQCVLQWVDTNTIESTSVGEPVPRRITWKRG